MLKKIINLNFYYIYICIFKINTKLAQHNQDDACKTLIITHLAQEILYIAVGAQPPRSTLPYKYVANSITQFLSMCTHILICKNENWKHFSIQIIS